MTVVVETIAETRALLDKEREAGHRIGFVPTMGYLHEGHASLMRAARMHNDVVVVSIFVNPLQFGPTEDLAAYPRDLVRDLEVCERERVDVVFHPSANEMYPDPNPFTVTVGEIGAKLCGRSRPSHFDGVVTVVSKLFNIAGPCRAYFGQKDAQQLLVIRRLARALDFPVEVVGCPIVREPDGLAMSSRNVYLTPDERRSALVLKAALDEAAAAIEQGERDGRRIADAMAARISSEPLARLDYAACVDPETLEEIGTLRGSALLAVAARFGSARLIDNLTVTL
ncbi:MAG TPA: pantoate--beta-alanine ligase [Actinomycetota bacterium]|nr:pantoate--beta-alanine ligase [Actinomycetota bacterium]